MIKSKKGEVAIVGEVTEVATDFTVLTKQLICAFQKTGMEKEESEEFVRKAFELAFKSEKEIQNEAACMLKDFLADLIKAIEEAEEEEENHE